MAKVNQQTKEKYRKFLVKLKHDIEAGKLDGKSLRAYCTEHKLTSTVGALLIRNKIITNHSTHGENSEYSFNFEDVTDSMVETLIVEINAIAKKSRDKNKKMKDEEVEEHYENYQPEEQCVPMQSEPDPEPYVETIADKYETLKRLQEEIIFEDSLYFVREMAKEAGLLPVDSDPLKEKYERFLESKGLDLNLGKLEGQGGIAYPPIEMKYFNLYRTNGWSNRISQTLYFNLCGEIEKAQREGHRLVSVIGEEGEALTIDIQTISYITPLL